MRGNRRLTFLGPGSPLSFPDPNDSDDEGLLAVGGDLSPKRLLFAYESGIFPWYSAGVPPLWWSPNPRALMDRHGGRLLPEVVASLKADGLIGGFGLSGNPENCIRELVDFGMREEDDLVRDLGEAAADEAEHADIFDETVARRVP